MMRLSKKLDIIPPYLFNEIDILKSSIKDPVDFGIGDPDMPTPSFIVEEASKQMRIAANHRYPSYSGMPLLRDAVKDYFQERFETVIDSDKEAVILIGSKEGIAHSIQSVIDPGDEVLVPSICYPVYRTQALINGAVLKEFPVRFEKGFSPSVEDIERSITPKTKLLFLNYPNNPTGATADRAFYEDITSLCYRKNIIIFNDAVYSEVYFGKEKPVSILQTKRGKDVALEFHSFSKTFNMTGWRVGFAAGNRELAGALKKIKMNTDSGVFDPIQIAAAKALKRRNAHIKTNNSLISKRMDMLCSALEEKGFEFKKSKATFYLFAKTLKGMDSFSMTKYLIKKAGIVTAPGIGFGADGDGFIRFSLTLNDSELERGISKIKAMRV